MKKYVNIILVTMAIALIFYIFSRVSEAAKNKERLKCTNKEIFTQNEIITKTKQIIRTKVIQQKIANKTSSSPNVAYRLKFLRGVWAEQSSGTSY